MYSNYVSFLISHPGLKVKDLQSLLEIPRLYLLFHSLQGAEVHRWITLRNIQISGKILQVVSFLQTVDRLHEGDPPKILDENCIN